MIISTHLKMTANRSSCAVSFPRDHPVHCPSQFSWVHHSHHLHHWSLHCGVLASVEKNDCYCSSHRDQGCVPSLPSSDSWAENILLTPVRVSTILGHAYRNGATVCPSRSALCRWSRCRRQQCVLPLPFHKWTNRRRRKQYGEGTAQYEQSIPDHFRPIYNMNSLEFWLMLKGGFGIVCTGVSLQHQDEEEAKQ